MSEIEPIVAAKPKRKRKPSLRAIPNIKVDVNGHNRSAVTSGRKLFVDGDPNSAWSRRYRDLVVGHIHDLGDGLSEAQLSLIRRASAIETELEQMDGLLSMGEEVDLDKYTRAAGHLRRLFETLGLKRVARKDEEEPLDEYLRRRQREFDEANAQLQSQDAAIETIADEALS